MESFVIFLFWVVYGGAFGLAVFALSWVTLTGQLSKFWAVIFCLTTAASYLAIGLFLRTVLDVLSEKKGPFGSPALVVITDLILLGVAIFFWIKEEAKKKA